LARLFSTGFELNSTTAGVEFTTVTNGTISTTTIRSGTYAGRISSLASGTARGFLYQFASAAGNGPYFIRFYFRYATLPSAANTIFSVDNDTAVAEAAGVAILLGSDGALQLFNGATQIGSDSSALSADTWYRIEVKFDKAPADGSEELRALIDGVEFAGAANLTLATTIHSMAFGGNIRTEAQTTGDWFFDDIAVNNSTGSFQNSYPGAGEIIHLRPNAAGDNAGWVDGTGTTFAEIDEINPDDITSYIQDPGPSNISDFNLDATPASLASDDVINCVQVGNRFAADDGFGDSRFVLRIKASAGGTLEETADINPSSTTFGTNAVANPRNYILTLYDLPGVSTTGWTKTDLDTTQIGVRATANDAGTVNMQVSTLWFLVDHQPAEAAGFSPNVSDSINVSENIQLQVVKNINVFDSITVAEFTTPQLVNNTGTVFDSVTVAESITASSVLNIDIFDSIVVSEAITAHIPQYFVDKFDSINISESIAVSSILNINVSDSITVSEFTDASIPLALSVFDSITIAETTTLSKVLHESVVDNLIVSEAVTIEENSFNVNVSDNIAIAESVISQKGNNTGTIFASIQVSENVTFQTILNINIFDSVAVSENITSSKVDNVNVFDSVTIAETTTLSKVLNANVFDSVNVSESITIQVPSLFINIFDSVTVNEAVSPLLITPDAVNVVDDIVISESVSVLISNLLISVFDSILVSEDITSSESVITTSQYRHLPKRLSHIGRMFR